MCYSFTPMEYWREWRSGDRKSQFSSIYLSLPSWVSLEGCLISPFERGASWISEVSPRSTLSAYALPIILLVWGACFHLQEVQLQPLVLEHLLDAGPPTGGASGLTEDGTWRAGGGRLQEGTQEASLGSQWGPKRSQAMSNRQRVESMAQNDPLICACIGRVEGRSWIEGRRGQLE